MNSTQRRRHAIRRIIAQRAVATQQELVDLLHRAGIEATQSSVSRDIAHLGLVKIGGRYAIPSERGFLSELPIEILSAEPADAIAVVKLPPGQASLLGVRIDSAGWPEVVGTVAGDDTLLVACRDRQARNLVLARLFAGVNSRKDRASDE